MDNPLRDQTGRVEPEEQILKVQFLIYTLGLHLKHELVLLLFFVFNDCVQAISNYVYNDEHLRIVKNI